ncbi:DNA-directed RNA polymerase subunit A' [Candidatus Micrarchaeota archaeon]|nr:DNA-directed RNA polymerase subunit A' [Candidatus Micrarchaeota archaeon]
MLTKKIISVDFHVLSPAQVRKMSALEVKSPETYDKDGYPMEAGLMDPHLGVINPGLRCKTCGQRMKQCPGHFGHLELVRPVVHSEFGKKVELLLHVTCKECGKIALPQETIDDYTKKMRDGEDVTKRIALKAKKIKKCPHCNAERGDVLLDKPTNFYYNKERLYPTQIREWLEKIPDEDVALFGYGADGLRPEWFVMTVLQVPAITIRPSITLDTGIRSEDDLTHKLVDIIRINLRLKDNIDAGAPQLIIEDLWDLLQYHVTTYFNNNTAGVPPAKHRSGRALRTLVQRLQGKKGRFRYNLTGKRVNFAARSIISPDAYLAINELGVPEEIAKALTVPEFVTKYNIKEMKKLVKGGTSVYVTRPDGMKKKITEMNLEEIVNELDIGYKVERQLMDGDVVIFNRQPSLHRLSMLAHKARIMPDKTFKLNPIVCKPYNADFDGDEMNMHVPQTEVGITEAEELMSVENQVISPRYGAPVIILDEDGISGCYILTLKSTKFGKEKAMQYLHTAGVKDLPKPDMGQEYSGKLIFSQLLPKGLNLEYKTKTCKMLQRAGKCSDCTKEKCKHDAYVKIKDGNLLCGIIDEVSLGEGDGRLVDTLARKYPSNIIADFYLNTSKIVEDLVTTCGMTVSLDEFETSDNVKKVKDRAIKEEIEKSDELVKMFHSGKLEHIPGRTLAESFEIRMMQLGAHIKDKVEKVILEERMDDVLGENPRFNSTVMIMSGSRGSAVNLTNISGLWGQASVREGRPKRGFRDRLITHNKKKDVGVRAGGFIEHNFLEGMDNYEYFYHAMGGRQGEVDTGVSTKVSGYLYRRLANSLKDLVVNNDSTVRNANSNIIQFVYGEDGVFPQKSARGKAMYLDTEIANIDEGKGKKE